MSANSPERREQLREASRRYRARHPGRRRAAVARWKRENRPAHNAHMRVLRAVERGDLVRPEICETPGCGGRDPHAHHDDYSRPLEVRWLCAPCHAAETYPERMAAR